MSDTDYTIPTDAERLDLAKRVAEAFPLTAAIEAARQSVIDNAPHWSDDGIDYMYASAAVYAHLMDIARNGGVYTSDDEYVAWLAESPCESWLATDGDFRWSLDGLLEDADPELAAEWAEMTEHALD